MINSGNIKSSDEDQPSFAYKPRWMEGYEYILKYPYLETEDLKKDIAKAVWNDERLLREDIEDIAKDLLRELRGG